MKKALFLILISFFFLGCTSIENERFTKNNEESLSQRVKNSTLKEEDRDLFNTAFVFRMHNKLYGKTVKQIVEGEREYKQLLDAQKKQAETFCPIVEYNFQVEFPDEWKIPLENKTTASIVERYNITKTSGNQKATAYMIIQAIPLEETLLDKNFSLKDDTTKQLFTDLIIDKIKTKHHEAIIDSINFLTFNKQTSLIVNYTLKNNPTLKHFEAHIIKNQVLLSFISTTTDVTDKHMAQFIEIIKSVKPLR